MMFDQKTKTYVLVALFLLFLGGILFYAKFAGLFMMLSLFVFGALVLLWHEKEIKLIGLGLIILLSIINIGLNGVHFGIDFSGGTRIPVILEKSVSESTMNELVQIIKKRANVLGLTEVKVKSVGNMEIDIEIPSGNEEQLRFIEEVLAHQGVYQGIVDGQVAITGEDIIPGEVRALPSSYLKGGADWGVSFSVTKTGADTFAKTVKGKKDYPLYMYLDRPEEAFVFLPDSSLDAEVPGASKQALLDAIADAIRMDGKTGSIRVFLIGETDVSALSPLSNRTRAVVPDSEEYASLRKSLEAKGFKVVAFTADEMRPNFIQSRVGKFQVERWEAIGLLSSPMLSEDITKGLPNYGYSITGSASGVGSEKTNEIIESEKRIESILKGGSLPVQISIGSRVAIPSSYGSEFLKLSLIGIVTALLAISVFVGLRYKHPKFIIPIVITSVSEFIILVSILGSYSIDLAAMAGIIAAIGVGVDAQIVITDEMLKKSEHPLDERIESAFQIIKTNVVVAVVVMLPLLFSGLVEVIGFAISTMLGAVLGYLLSRPAYATIVKELVAKEKEAGQI